VERPTGRCRSPDVVNQCRIYSSPCLCLSIASHFSQSTSRQSVRPLVCIQLGLDRNRLATISARPPAVERPRVTESWSGRSLTRCLGSFSRECTRRRVAPHCINKCSRGRDEHRCCRLPNCTQIPAYKHRQFCLTVGVIMITFICQTAENYWPDNCRIRPDGAGA